MDLLVSQLKNAIRRVLDAKGVRARVLDKVNRYGEVVIGVILERAAAADPSLADVRTSGRDTPETSPPQLPTSDAEVGEKRTVDTSHEDAAMPRPR